MILTGIWTIAIDQAFCTKKTVRLPIVMNGLAANLQYSGQFCGLSTQIDTLYNEQERRERKETHFKNYLKA